MEMTSFQHITPALRVAYGPESLKQLGRELNRMGCSRAAVFCGPWMVDGPLLERVRLALGDRFAGVYSRVDAHSPIASVEEAARELKELSLCHPKVSCDIGALSWFVSKDGFHVLIEAKRDSCDRNGQSPHQNLTLYDDENRTGLHHLGCA